MPTEQSSAPLGRIGLLLLVVVATTLGACRGMPSSRPPIHINPNMDHQEKSLPQQSSDFFYDGRAMRLPVAGTVAIGELRENADLDSGKFTGRNAAGEYLQTSPIEVTDAVLAWGENRYTIYCRPCHDRRGTGRGILFDYGTPTATFHDEIRLAYPDGQIFDVITNGLGLMKGYSYQLSPEDRWAVVAYVNQLQDQRQARALTAGGM